MHRPEKLPNCYKPLLFFFAAGYVLCGVQKRVPENNMWVQRGRQLGQAQVNRMGDTGRLSKKKLFDDAQIFRRVDKASEN